MRPWWTCWRRSLTTANRFGEVLEDIKKADKKRAAAQEAAAAKRHEEMMKGLEKLEKALATSPVKDAAGKRPFIESPQRRKDPGGKRHKKDFLGGIRMGPGGSSRDLDDVAE